MSLATLPREATLIAALSRPEAYPHRPERVEVRSTHISRVFLAGPWVYKVKRPVRFGFVDYSTPELRLHFCREELRLNRRLAPSVYLAVVPIFARGTEIFVADGGPVPEHATIVEHAVKMRRLASEQMLDRRVRNGVAGSSDMAALAARIAEFHATCPVERDPRICGGAAIAARMGENLDELDELAGRVLRDADLARARGFLEALAAEHGTLLDRRLLEGRVREGHGDLRAEHVCFEDSIEIVDCVEFSAGLRTADVASDLAFLTMDLDFLGARALSAALLSAYEARTGDGDLARLRPFYECDRALVRAKVESIRGLEDDADPAAAAAARGRARLYLHLACRIAGAAPPALIAACGMQGTGKSTFARRLSETANLTWVSSDLVRKELAGVPPVHDPRPPDWLYTPEMTERTYGELLTRAERELASGRSVVLDATFADPGRRRRVLELADRARVVCLFTECRADESEIERRLSERVHHPEDVSDATVEVYREARSRFTPLDDIPETNRVVIDTGDGVEDGVGRVRASLLRW